MDFLIGLGYAVVLIFMALDAFTSRGISTGELGLRLDALTLLVLIAISLSRRR